MRFSLTEKSGNQKTGPIATSYTSKASCPPSCTLMGAGCYAEFGHARRAWDLTAHYGYSLTQFLYRLRALPAGSMLRHNVAGDLPGRGAKINKRSLWRLLSATKHLISWTYTHKTKDGLTLALANLFGSMVINASADSLEQADELYEAGLPTVVALPYGTRARGFRTKGGNLVAICPEQLRQETTCKTCGDGSPLCARRDRDFIVGFLAHGAGKRKVGT